MSARRRLPFRFRGTLVACLLVVGGAFASFRAQAADDLKTGAPESTVKSGAGELETTKAGGTVSLTPPPSTTAAASSAAASAKPGVTASAEPSIGKPADDRRPPAHRVAAGSPSASSPGADGAESGDDVAAPPSASASSSVGASSAAILVRRTIPLGIADLAVAVKVPEDWPALGDASLPVVDVSGQDGVSVLTRAGFGYFAPKGKPPIVHELVVACARASGDRWADAVRDAAFTQLVSGVEKEAQKYSSLGSIEPEPMRTVGSRFEQSFSAHADVEVGGAQVRAVGSKAKSAVPSLEIAGRSVVAFAHDKPDDKGAPAIVACSITCADIASHDATVCPSVIGSIELSGAFAPPPTKSLLVEWVMRLRRDPTLAWLLGIGVTFVVLAGVGIPLALRVRRRRGDAVAAHDDDGDDEDDDDDERAPTSSTWADPATSERAAAEVRSKMLASPPPPTGYYDPQTLQRRRV